jgi:hypothetical protein
MKALIPPILMELERAGLLRAFSLAEDEVDLAFYSNPVHLHDPAYLRDWPRSWGLSGEAALQLHPFAHDGSGGLVCLWHYYGLKTSPPVVFAGSEGEMGILANDLVEFLFLAAYGYDPHELNECMCLSDARPQEAIELVDWLSQRFGRPAFSDPFDAVRAARKAHPDFCRWIDNNLIGE